jgi:hypothetical protein
MRRVKQSPDSIQHTLEQARAAEICKTIRSDYVRFEHTRTPVIITPEAAFPMQTFLMRKVEVCFSIRKELLRRNIVRERRILKLKVRNGLQSGLAGRTKVSLLL